MSHWQDHWPHAIQHQLSSGWLLFRLHLLFLEQSNGFLELRESDVVLTETLARLPQLVLLDPLLAGLGGLGEVQADILYTERGVQAAHGLQAGVGGDGGVVDGAGQVHGSQWSHGLAFTGG